MKPFPFAPLAIAGLLFIETSAAAQTNWATSIKLPAAERKTKASLFNGKDLTGWEGQTNRYWSVVDGLIRGANTDKVPASTYLWTKKSYRNFRLLFEVKQSRNPSLSTTHSAIAVLGEKFTDQGDPFSFKGPLLMFCNDWGIWDANRRNRVFPAGHQGTLQSKAENVGQWNRIEVLVLGDHIRMVANGLTVIDFTDQPGMLQAAPIGLQLHSNDRPQEFHFRGLVLTENPSDKLLTLEKSVK
jgi:hypothetical protein